MHRWTILKNSRALSALSHDIGVVIIAWVVAYLLRFNFNLSAEFISGMWMNLLWVLPLQAITFSIFGLYQGVWRFASIPDLKRILKAIAVSGLLIVAIYLMFKPFGVIPRSVLLLNPILLILAMGASRFAYRAWKEHRQYGSMGAKGKPVIVLGAGEAAIALVKDLARSETWQVVGLLDDDEAIVGRQLEGARVLGTIKDLPTFSSKYEVQNVIVAMPSVEHLKRRAAVDAANACDMTVLTVPAFDDLISGKVSISQIRKVEVEDLLGREPVQLDTLGLHDLIEDNAILVTGAGGSIGSELCRQILKYHPSQLICVDTSEFSLYQIEQEFSQLKLDDKTNIIYVTANVRNEKRIKALLTTYQPTVVYHAAAYKHVPLMENMNVAEALSNNVLGTYTVAKACNDTAVSKFVLISTDKAVNPTNVMGASKRLAEMVCQGLQGEGGTKFVTVRFGNVLGSSGSVIPKFREQIANGGPVTITHPEITRYFMSIPEAAQLVMQAGMMGSGGEIFVLDMGESVKIVNLAKDMIRLSGLSEDEVDIVYTGLRPGEKLYEELLADDEHTLSTPHDKLRIAEARTADFAWVHELLAWIESIHDEDEDVIKAGLKTWVEEYEIDMATSKHASRTAETVPIH
ncbi:MAG: nucleoside-diphosphate sugar epimerase/dehydratase [Methylophilaceae bacterium]|nr:nucleoside-diphosphate sugar epimerase/dehydratase [Methylophilaceae bacterium]